MEEKDPYSVIKALSDENRMKIVTIVSAGEISASSILEKLNISQPTLSHHMSVLQKSGIIDSERRGQSSYYTLNKTVLNMTVNYLLDLSIPGKVKA